MALQDNLEEKIKTAKAAGYSDAQINTYLQAQGVQVPKTSLGSTLIKGAEKVTDTLGLHKTVDTIGSNLATLANPRAALEGRIDQPSLIDNVKAGVSLGLTVPAPEVGGALLGVGKNAIKKGADVVAKKTTEAVADISTAASDIVTPIEKGVETLLKSPETPQASARLSEKLQKYASQSERAIADYNQPTAMELAGHEGERALKALQIAKTTIGERKSAITSAIGNTPVPEIVTPARKLLRDLVRERTGIVMTANQTLRKAAGRLSNVSDAADIKLIKTVDSKLAELEKNPTFQRADDTVDFIQDLLFKRSGATAVPVSGKIEGALKSVVKGLNDGLKASAKKAGNTDYEALNTAYGDYKETFDLLNKGLGLEGNKGASLMKQLFSPNGTLPRKLFADIKAKTGIDLVEEATLAKFAMENIGDVRQASLLEQVLKGQVGPNSSSLIQIAADKILGAIKDPMGKAKRLIESSK